MACVRFRNRRISLPGRPAEVCPPSGQFSNRAFRFPVCQRTTARSKQLLRQVGNRAYTLAPAPTTFETRPSSIRRRGRDRFAPEQRDEGLARRRFCHPGTTGTTELAPARSAKALDYVTGKKGAERAREGQEPGPEEPVRDSWPWALATLQHTRAKESAVFRQSPGRRSSGL